MVSSSEITWSKRIQIIRVWLDLNQRELADLLDVSVASVASWEQGLHIPGRRSVKDLEKLCGEKDIEFRYPDGYPIPKMLA